MRLHQHGGKLGEQRAGRRELFVRRSDGKTRRHRVALAPGTVPAADKLAARCNGVAGAFEKPRRTVAVHDRVAGDHADAAPMRGSEQRLGRGRMRRAVSACGGGAVSRQLVEEEFGVVRGVFGNAEFLLLDESVFLQPFEELGAIGGNHLGLRIVDMRVDESRHDQRIGIMIERNCRWQPRQKLVGRADKLDPTVAFHQDDAVCDIAVALRVAGAVRRAQEAQQAAADRTHPCVRQGESAMAGLKGPRVISPVRRLRTRRRAGGAPWPSFR
jgi:hypothetical protein